MKFRNYLTPMMAFVFLATVTASYASSVPQEVEAVFGLTAANETTAVAFWVPLGEGDSVAGVEWFNNDGDVVFPELLAVAGDVDSPEAIFDATTIAYQVSGTTLGWSELVFEQSLASTAEGVFLIWRLPLDDGFVAAGQGAGFGVVASSGQNTGWITTDGDEWNSFTVPHQMAMTASMGTDKSSGVLVLSKPGESLPVEEAIENEAPLKRGLMLSAHPNPFNPSVELSFSLKTDGLVDVSVFDIRGRLMQNLEHGIRPKGLHQIIWNGQTSTGRIAPSGVYFAKVNAGGIQQSIRITLAK